MKKLERNELNEVSAGNCSRICLGEYGRVYSFDESPRPLVEKMRGVVENRDACHRLCEFYHENFVNCR